MERKCKHSDCYVPDTSCVMGWQEPKQCEHWQGTPETTGEVPSVTATRDRITVPWSGGAMGLSDIEFVAARGTPRVVAIVGPHDAGKSTFLATLFLLLLRHGGVQPYLFSSSFSLIAWEQVARHMKWKGSEPPKFPPHTTAFEGRTPGLLHLGFRGPNNSLQDLLLVDAPGEWFQQWAFNRDAPGAEGARWVAAHADVFVLFADCAALAGEKRGEARVVLKQIIDRVRSEQNNRPVLLVWSKSDKEIKPEIRSSIHEACQRFGQITEFPLSVMPLPPNNEVHEKAFLDVLHALLALSETQSIPVGPPPDVTTDRFLSYRGAAYD
jgi:hypothetical protein